MPYNFLMLSGVVALAYAGLCAALFVFQRSFIYFPKPQSPNASKNRFALPVDGASVIITTRSHSSPNAVVYFGGNAEDVSLRMPSLSTAFPDYAIYLLHYRGYGGSSGKPSEAALFADALALFDKVYTKHQNIVVVGRSLGSGVAVHLASLRPVTRLVLVTPYNSIQELAARQFPYIPVRWLLVDKFESWKYAKLVNAPTLIIAAEHDEVIPRASTESLFACFRIGVASFKVVLGTSHNTIYDSIDYLPLLGRWELT
jgi:uncharacterized protein